jgi:HK97 family phage prohead protease
VGRITVVVGPPAAGKSTWVTEQRSAGDVVVDMDRLAQALGSDTPHDAPAAVAEVAFAARRAAVGRILAGVEADAWIIHTRPSSAQMARYEEAAAEVVVLDPGMDACLERAASDGRPEGTEDVIRRWYEDPPDLTRKSGRRAVRIKSCPVQVKAVGELDGLNEGEFTSIVAAYNTDSVGDRIVPGAFAETLAEWKGRGDPIPVLWSHMSHDPDYHIGEVLEAEERPEGLWVKARVDLDEESPKARRVYKLLKARRVTQFSFAYDIEAGSWVDEKGGESYYELRKLKLYEVGPTLIGANQQTELLDVKSGDRALRLTVEGATPKDAEDIRTAVEAALGAKAGRVLSAKNETALRGVLERIKEAGDDLDEVLSAVSTDENDDDEKAKAGPAAAPEEPAGAKGGRESQPVPASNRLRSNLALLSAEVELLTE